MSGDLHIAGPTPILLPISLRRCPIFVSRQAIKCTMACNSYYRQKGLPLIIVHELAQFELSCQLRLELQTCCYLSQTWLQIEGCVETYDRLSLASETAWITAGGRSCLARCYLSHRAWSWYRFWKCDGWHKNRKSDHARDSWELHFGDSWGLKI